MQRRRRRRPSCSRRYASDRARRRCRSTATSCSTLGVIPIEADLLKRAGRGSATTAAEARPLPAQARPGGPAERLSELHRRARSGPTTRPRSSDAPPSGQRSALTATAFIALERGVGRAGGAHARRDLLPARVHPRLDRQLRPRGAGCGCSPARDAAGQLHGGAPAGRRAEGAALRRAGERAALRHREPALLPLRPARRGRRGRAGRRVLRAPRRGRRPGTCCGSSTCPRAATRSSLLRRREAQRLPDRHLAVARVAVHPAAAPRRTSCGAARSRSSRRTAAAGARSSSEQGRGHLRALRGRARARRPARGGLRARGSAGWKGQRGTAMAQDTATRGFYSELARDAAYGEVLALYFLRLDGRPVAFHFGAAPRRHATCCSSPATTRGCKECSPGQLLMEEVLQGLRRPEADASSTSSDRTCRGSATGRTGCGSTPGCSSSATPPVGRALCKAKFQWVPDGEGEVVAMEGEVRPRDACSFPALPTLWPSMLFDRGGRRPTSTRSARRPCATSTSRATRSGSP